MTPTNSNRIPRLRTASATQVVAAKKTVVLIRYIFLSCSSLNSLFPQQTTAKELRNGWHCKGKEKITETATSILPILTSVQQSVGHCAQEEQSEGRQTRAHHDERRAEEQAVRGETPGKTEEGDAENCVGQNRDRRWDGRPTSLKEEGRRRVCQERLAERDLHCGPRLSFSVGDVPEVILRMSNDFLRQTDRWPTD
eukprot:Selendium_serpulae@DN2758_c0_g1_i1.p1